MKEKVVYLLIFAFAFILVTGAMFVMNDKYENVFHLDFRDRQAVMIDKHIQDSVKVVQDSIKNKMVQDSIARKEHPDSVFAANPNAQPETAGGAPESVAGKSDDKQNQLASSVAAPLNAKAKAEKDSSYAKWKRQTVKLYEAMDAKQIARVLPTFSDDVARDLLYSMKNKKAGEVLTLLSPDVVHRLTQAR